MFWYWLFYQHNYSFNNFSSKYLSKYLSTILFATHIFFLLISLLFHQHSYTGINIFFKKHTITFTDRVLHGFLPTRIHKTDYKIKTKEYLTIIATATIAVSTRIPKLVDTDKYFYKLSDKGKQIWLNFLNDCKNIPELNQNDSWLRFKNLEISIGY